jgi:hypothetical protein
LYLRIKVLCDGESTEGTNGRQKILTAVHDGNVAIAYKTLLGMRTAERRELVGKANAVYIYHNAIDAVGDKILSLLTRQVLMDLTVYSGPGSLLRALILRRQIHTT